MDQSALPWTGAPPRTENTSTFGRWMRIHYRAMRLRRLTRRAERDPWTDHVSPWMYWGLHR
ncbi:hypothetical protein AB4Z18_17865 [Leifsonia sp. 2TAF2]|uniref:hypothetical protein n=1 Tax=Leifsonia sp. 2TAF2 TaxID=3233009 RepID=UPI003F9B1A51